MKDKNTKRREAVKRSINLYRAIGQDIPTSVIYGVDRTIMRLPIDDETTALENEWEELKMQKITARFRFD